jgi:hypothetical protein
LYVPGRDAGANVKIENALAKLDKPLAAKALKAAKVEITPLSREGYAAAAKARKVTAQDIEQSSRSGLLRPSRDGRRRSPFPAPPASSPRRESVEIALLAGEDHRIVGDRIFRIEILGQEGEPIQPSPAAAPARAASPR